MAFGPNNPVVKRCIQGMGLEAQGLAAEAADAFVQAWNGAQDDFERFLAAHFVARSQAPASERLRWLETALKHAQAVNEAAVQSAFPPLYAAIAECHEALGDSGQAERHRQSARSSASAPIDPGPFYHGTKADLKAGDRLEPGRNSNYQSELVMNHIYFTALMHGAGLAAGLAQGEGSGRVYAVEPTGPFEDDPNVTNHKFPGNPTRSYRSSAPLKVIAEVVAWEQLSAEELERWREKLAAQKGKIIN